MIFDVSVYMEEVVVVIILDIVVDGSGVEGVKIVLVMINLVFYGGDLIEDNMEIENVVVVVVVVFIVFF